MAGKKANTPEGSKNSEDSKRPAGRPKGDGSKYTKELAEQICERISKGETLRGICREEGMPGVATVADWRKEHEDFSVSFARARELGADAIAEQALEIADTPCIGDEISIDKEGNVTTFRSDMVAHRKLQVETRLKLLAKWFPTKYGDKIQQEHSGEIKMPPIQIINPG